MWIIRECKPTSGGGHYLYLQTHASVWWGSMHAISSYRGNYPQTNKQTNTATNPQTGPITIHYAAASAQCNDIIRGWPTV